MASSSASSSHTSRRSMSSPVKDLDDKEFRERVLFALRHQIRPADEVDAVRRVMARNLAENLGMNLDNDKDDGKGSSSKGPLLASPLALVDADLVLPSPPPPSAADLSPLQREFVEAVRTNVELRADFAQAREELLAAEQQQQQQKEEDEEEEEDDETTEALEAELLQLQLRQAGLQEEIGRYQVALRHMERLGQQPAAQPGFLDPETMFREAGCDPLPEMPRELMDSFTIDRGASEARAQALFQRLKKESVRQKLVAQQQERRADEARARNPSLDPASAAAAPPEVQLRALGAVKDHLIGWIETHLSIAGGDGDEDGEDEPSFVAESPEKKQQQGESPRKQAEKNPADDDNDDEEYDYEAQLAEVQREYDRHVELRKEVLALLSYHEKMTGEWSQILKKDQREQEQKTGNKSQDDEPVPRPPPTTNASLITPYVEKLQAIAREQKGLAQEKSHINATLARHQQETREMLSHLAEESQLLARFPSAARGRTPEVPSSSSASASADFGEAISAAKETSGSLATQLEPWLLAADAAKLATLETVAEKVEEGQMAVDEAMAALDEARKLLNREEEGEGDGSVDGEEATGGEGLSSRARNVSTGTGAGEGGKSIYAKLDGNLGLINE
ncbi:hypothetical protein SLS62_004721 [Diatrype stigma]|uniref:Uncharacterized protein n=1 Tax=Diatrype stigma TaxID=117547 RepID=A0AAN9UU17_9PEZI